MRKYVVTLKQSEKKKLIDTLMLKAAHVSGAGKCGEGKCGEARR